MFYEQLETAKAQAGSQDVLVVMGDLNAKVGSGTGGRVVGPFGLGERNERGDRWLEWCEETDQIICNTCYRHHPRNLWAWSSPGDQYRNQIDYITINNRFRNSITQVKTYLGADGGSDHVPVLSDMRVRLRKLKRRRCKPCKDTAVISEER